MEAQIATLTIESVSGPVLCRSHRRVLGRVRPNSVEQVAAVVAEARKRGWRTHAVSSGMNWGMGSYLPGEDDRLLIYLSKLNKVGPIDRVAGTVKIEAGVTQRQLYDWLQDNAPEMAFNVTGASERTSIVGNAMQRGIGYDGSRADELFGHDVVLPDGTWHRPEPEWFSATGSSPVGPRFDALWSQSEYGIVTSAWLHLRRKQALEVAVIMTGSEEQIGQTLVEAYRTNLLTLPTHMAGNERAERVGSGLLWQHWGRKPTAEEVKRIFPQTKAHTAIAAIRGQVAVVKAALRRLRQIAPRAVDIKAVSSERMAQGLCWTKRLGWQSKYDFLASVQPLLAMTWGEPSDAGMAAVAVDPAANPDDAKMGMVYFNAVAPMDLEQSRRVESLVRELLPTSSLTRVFEGAGKMVHIFSVEFSDDAAEETHALLLQMGKKLRAAGYPPYRLGSVRADDVDSLIQRRGQAIWGAQNRDTFVSTGGTR